MSTERRVISLRGSGNVGADEGLELAQQNAAKIGAKTQVGFAAVASAVALYRVPKNDWGLFRKYLSQQQSFHVDVNSRFTVSALWKRGFVLAVWIVPALEQMRFWGCSGNNSFLAVGYKSVNREILRFLRLGNRTPLKLTERG